MTFTIYNFTITTEQLIEGHISEIFRQKGQLCTVSHFQTKQRSVVIAANLHYFNLMRNLCGEMFLKISISRSLFKLDFVRKIWPSNG